MKKRLEFVTILYGIAPVLVVFGHSHPLHCDFPEWLHQITAFLYIFHMPLFFVIAGILLEYTLDRDHVFAWWLPKARKLIVPYAVLTILAWVPKAMLGSLMNDNMEVSASNLLRILFVPREGIWGHFWFIPVYLVLMLGCGYLWKHIKYSPAGIGGVLFAAAILNIFPINTGWFGIKDISQNFLYVLMGCCISEMVTGAGKRYFNVGLGLSAFALSIVLFAATDDTQTVIANRFICILMLYAMLSLGLFLERYGCHILKVVGSHAFTVYVYSWPVQAVVEMGAVVVLGLPWYAAFIMMFLSGLVIPLALYTVYTKFFKRNRFLDAMIGVK